LPNPKNPMQVGLTGGIGSGKSEVARILAQLGAYIIDTDELAREAVEPGSEATAAIARVWPNVIRAGKIDRTALAEIVFADARQREKLNSLIHPIVRTLARAREKNAKPGQLIVHVVPLLFETGYDGMVQKTILVVAPLDQRIRRVQHRDNIEESKIRARMAAQIDPVAASERADFIIDNDGDLTHLRERTRAMLDQLAVSQ
jgi:dephospho-CoA kinase